MISQPDKLFRDGLGKYQKAAPSTAWDRIESGLDRKRTLSPWLKIAAGLLILIATSVMILPLTNVNKQLAISNKQEEISNQLPSRGRGQNGNKQGAESREHRAESIEQMVASSSKLSKHPATNTDVHREGIKQEEKSNHLPFRGRGQNSNRQEAVDKQQSRGINSGQLAVGRQPSVVGDQALNNNNSSSDHNNEVIASQANIDSMISTPISYAHVEITKELSAPVVAAQTERTNLTYSAKEVNARFLKKELPADATSEKKNTSGLQKVVTVAMDLRYEESLVGELREKKNEWLSINTSPKKKELNK